jgi:alkanesulfonate monooxygenase SsuD/methylene tetrahydromethanopterin reductase-like flavin-dependent oxidoreductase (luciferase family)
MAKRFRFGIQLAEAASRDEWIQQSRQAERLGYDVVVMPDHVGEQLAPLPALVSVAEATKNVRLGTFVVDNDFRHPLLLAHRRRGPGHPAVRSEARRHRQRVYSLAGRRIRL